MLTTGCDKVLTWIKAIAGFIAACWRMPQYTNDSLS